MVGASWTDENTNHMTNGSSSISLSKSKENDCMFKVRSIVIQSLNTVINLFLLIKEKFNIGLRLKV